MVDLAVQAVCVAADRLDELQLTDPNIEMLIVAELPSCRRAFKASSAPAENSDPVEAKQQRADQVKAALGGP